MKATTLFSSWENPQDVSRANLLFENRNKSYGGYFIRVRYPDRITRAFIIAVLGFTVLVDAPLLLEKYSSHTVPAAAPIFDYVIEFTQPPPLEQPVIPPSVPTEEIKKQLVNTTKWIPPVVVDDVKNTDDVKAQDDLLKTILGTETVKTDNTEVVTTEVVLPAVDDRTYKGWEIQELPMFPGGEEALAKYLGCMHYPRVAIEEGIKGTVYVTFIVNREGKVAEAKVVKGIGGGCDEEALRVVRAMPLWRPGKMNGTPVSVQFNLPVSFNLRRSF